jgi:hypothetical protein
MAKPFKGELSGEYGLVIEPGQRRVSYQQKSPAPGGVRFFTNFW